MNAIFASLLLFVSLPAHAYIPPPSFILSETMKNHGAIKTLIMEGKVTDLRSQASMRETLKIDFLSGKISATYGGFTLPAGASPAGQNPGSGAIAGGAVSVDANAEGEGVYENQVRDLHKLGKFWLTLGIDPSDSRFKEALQELSIQPNEKTEAILGRVGHSVIWEWGSDPRVGFLEDEFLPAIYRTGNTDPFLQEIFIPEYTSAGAAVRVPKTVVIRLQNKDAFRFEVKNVRMNPVIKTWAAPQALKSAMAREWVSLVR